MIKKWRGWARVQVLFAGDARLTHPRLKFTSPSADSRLAECYPTGGEVHRQLNSAFCSRRNPVPLLLPGPSPRSGFYNPGNLRCCRALPLFARDSRISPCSGVRSPAAALFRCSAFSAIRCFCSAGAIACMVVGSDLLLDAVQFDPAAGDVIDKFIFSQKVGFTALGEIVFGPPCTRLDR